MNEKLSQNPLHECSLEEKEAIFAERVLDESAEHKNQQTLVDQNYGNYFEELMQKLDQCKTQDDVIKFSELLKTTKWEKKIWPMIKGEHISCKEEGVLDNLSPKEQNYLVQ